MAPQVHPFRHHPQRLARDQPRRDRIQVMLRLALADRAGLALVQDDEAVLPLLGRSDQDSRRRQLALHSH